MGSLRLEFGYNAGLPEGALAAWGARAILERNERKQERLYTKAGTRRKRGVSPADKHTWRICLVPDRKSVVGAQDMVTTLMQKLVPVFDQVLEVASNLLDHGILSYSEAMEAEVWHKDGLIVKANSNGSHGYLYMVAYIEPPPKSILDSLSSAP